jgi:DNA-binding NtrC family response regulator
MEAVVASEAMRGVLEVAERVARSNATVLITGESGSGKELVARAIHQYSARSLNPWVDISCAALPEHLIESELFGYEKGAFSGADSTKRGLFEMAHTGTIFLDEIGELEPRMQAKLLRVLDGVPYYRLGGTRKVSVDVRVVSASNRDLAEAVAQGQFRSDLYHRLTQFTLHVPPLRERVEDIAPLAAHFLAQHDAQLSFTESALALLRAQDWPGNIRELRNSVISAAVWSGREIIDSKDFSRNRATGRKPGFDSRIDPQLNPRINPKNSPGTNPEIDDEDGGSATEHSDSSGSLDSSGFLDSSNLGSIERQTILDTIASTGGHQQKAAARLGISRRTLHRKLKRYRPEGLGVTI